MGKTPERFLMGYSDEVLADSPLLYYQMNESTGDLVDSGSNGWDAPLISGSPTYSASSKVGTGIRFTANDQFFRNTPSVRRDTPFTVEFWINAAFSGTTFQWVLGATDSSSSSAVLGISVIDSSMRIHRGINSFDYTFTTALTANTWYHIALRFPSDGTQPDVFVDGALDGSFSTTDPALFDAYESAEGSGQYVTIGSDLGHNFNYTLDEIAYYPSVLSATRIQAHFDAASGISIEPPAMSATTAAKKPTVSTSVTIAPGAASATANFPTPNVGVGPILSPPAATATADAKAPNINTDSDPYAAEIMADSPNAYWRLGEASGTTALDEANQIDGAYTNSPTLGEAGIEGTDDTAVKFTKTGSGASATGEWVDVPHDSLINPTSAITVECWAKNVDATWTSLGQLVSKRDAFILHPQGQNGTGRDITFYINTGSWTNTGSATVDDITVWNHYVGTYDGSNIKLYVNGSLAASAAVTGSITADTGNLFIGRDDGIDGDRFMNGWIDEVAVYPTALSATRIQAHYDAGIARKIRPPAATATADAKAPAVSTVALTSIDAPVATASADAKAPVVPVVVDTTLDATATAPIPTVHVSYTADVPVATATADAKPPTVSSGSSYTGHILGLNPVHYWRFEDTSSTVTDDGSRGFDLTHFNSPTLGADGIPQGGESTEYAAVTNEYTRYEGTDTTAWPSGDWSWDAWFLIPDDFDASRNTVFWGGNGNHTLTFSVLDAQFNLTLGTGSSNRLSTNTSYDFLPGHWYHAVVAVDRTNDQTKVYIDGEQVFQSTDFVGDVVPYDVANGAKPVIGKESTDTYSNMRVAHMAFYNTYMSLADVQENWRKGHGPYFTEVQQDSPEMYLRFNEVAFAGSTTKKTVADHSASGTRYDCKRHNTNDLALIPGIEDGTDYGHVFSGDNFYYQEDIDLQANGSGTSGVCVEGWFQHDGSIGYTGLFGSSGDSSTGVWPTFILEVGGGEFRLSYGGTNRLGVNEWFVQNEVITAGYDQSDWNYVVINFSDTEYHLFLNNTEIASGTHSGTVDVARGGERALCTGAVGRRNDPSIFSGSIDEVAVYSKELSATDISNHWSAGQPSATAGTNIPAMSATAAMPVPTIEAPQVNAVPATATADAKPATISGTAFIKVDNTVTARASAPAPQIITDSIITAPVASATADAKAPARSTSDSVDAVTGTATADAKAPSISTGVTVSAPVADATAQAETPTISGDATINGVTGAATAALETPTITTTKYVDIAAPTLDATAQVPAPTIHADSVLSAPVASATADAPAPGVGADRTIAAPVATATADAKPASIAVSEAIAPPAADATANALAPVLHVSVVLTAVTAGATADAKAPQVQHSKTIDAADAGATANAHAPTIGTGNTVSAVTATATADAPAPTFGAVEIVDAVPATATADAPAPSLSVGVTLSAPVANADTQAHSPVIGTSTTVGGVAASATADALAPTIHLSPQPTAPPATATADAPAPSIDTGLTVSAPVAQSTAAMQAPAVTTVEAKHAPVATATASAPSPTVSTTSSTTVDAPSADATGDGHAPTLHISASVDAVTSSATADAQAPSVQSNELIEPPAATAQADAHSPVLPNTAVLAENAAASTRFEEPRLLIIDSDQVKLLDLTVAGTGDQVSVADVTATVQIFGSQQELHYNNKVDIYIYGHKDVIYQ